MMFRFKLNHSFTIWLLISLGLLFAAGCDATAGTSTVSAPPLPTSSPICSINEVFYTSNDGAIGRQNQKAAILANDIYSQYLSNPNNLELARGEAIDFLAYETKRWTHIEDVRVDDYNSMRVVVTFFSPELIRAILLNHALFNVFQSPTSGSTLTDFSNGVLSVMDNQKKYLFLIAIQSATGNESETSIQMPSSQVVLVNNGGMRVNVINNDNFLDQTFKFSSPPHAGFLFYPFGSLDDGSCKRVLDPSRDTSITLSIDTKFGNVPRTITWEIPFAPPLPVSGPLPTPNPGLAQFNGEKTPLEEFPIFDLSQLPDDAYWHVWGRFIWGK